MLGKVFKAYDVRGTSPDPLNEKMARQIGCGVARFLLTQAEAAGETSPMMRNIVVGRDMRTTSPDLSKALIEGINSQGADVLEVGLVDTPFTYFAINHFDCAGGVMTTASHNPPNYNGFKVAGRCAKPVGESTGLGEIRKYAAMLDVNNGPGGGRSEPRDLWEAYSEHVLASLDLGGKSVKVVIDASNGMAGTMVPKVFGNKGAKIDGLQIIELNFDNSKGEFVHEPNPLVASNLQQLQEAVRAHQADLGICFDGDADRCVVVDERGAIVGCDHLTGALAAFTLKEHGAGPVVYDLRSTRALPEAVSNAGGKPVRSRVGHVFMKAAMAEHKCVFGGELSGHFYFSDNFNADSGAIAMVAVLNLLATSGKPMSQIVAPLQMYRQSGEINFTTEEQEEALRLLRDEFSAEASSIDELDGVTIDCFDDAGWWCNVRKSNTEPLLRLNLEARDDATLERMMARVAPMLGTRVDH